jgi:Zn-dependent peptidase ImmA (M78 family)
MKLPKKIKVLGQSWKIVTKSLDTDCFGLCCPGERTIYIDSEMHPCQLAATLLHEFCHAVFSVSGANNLLDEQVEEMLCEVLASALEPLLYKRSADDAE